MKKISILLLTIWICGTFTSCLEDDCVSTQEFFRYDPVYINVDDMRSSGIQVLETRALESPGKLYFYKNMLFLNEKSQGIHIIDISDRDNPQYLKFYGIEGNYDLAIKNDILYVDQIVDLVSIDISDINSPTILTREENYIERYIGDNRLIYAYSTRSPQTTIIDCGNQNFGQQRFFNEDVVFLANDAGAEFFDSNVASGDGGTGTGGSFARFTITSNNLYTVDQSNLSTWDISDGALERVATKSLGWGIETVFPYKENLFIGSNSGMFIFDISNPDAPTLQATFEHARACDPVIVQDDIAYVTLRDGSECQGFVNQLEVIDVSNLSSPKLIKTIDMKNPHGLSYRNNRLYVGEGSHGTQLLDASDLKNPKKVELMQDLPGYDMIAMDNNDVFVTGEGGFYIINTNDPNDVKIRSHIPVSRN